MGKIMVWISDFCTNKQNKWCMFGLGYFVMGNKHLVHTSNCMDGSSVFFCVCEFK